MLNKNIIYIYSIFILFICTCILFASSLNDRNHLISSERYITDENGNILMNVNVWGHVKLPGNHLVYDGVDLITLLSIVGGPKIGANLSNIKLFREVNDNNGKNVYQIDLNKFYKNGDRSDLVKIMPNDTIIIKEKISSTIFRTTNFIPIFLQLLNIYIQLEKQ